jgi:hypothetical protein
MRIGTRAWLAAPLLWAALSAAAQQAPPVDLGAYPVPLSEPPESSAQIGRMRPRGMLALPTNTIGNIRLSQLSGLAWDDDDQVLYALSDKGYLFHLAPEFQNDTLVNVRLLKAVALEDPKTGKPLKRGDTEGLDIISGRNGRRGDAELLVSFERSPRIVRYRPDGKASGDVGLPPPLTDPKHYASANRMLESVCHDETFGVLTAAEEPLADDTEGMARLFSTSGKFWRYPLPAGLGITALECLGNGRILVLERMFGIARRVASLKLVRLTEKTDVPLTPEAVATLDAGAGHRLDNFEGLTRHRGNRFFLVSDDNDLFLQRTLLFYFELLE